MTDPAPDRQAEFRRSIYMLLVCIGIGAALGRILAVDAVDKPPKDRRPFLSANDRSRWCTVRALVEKDMRVEDAPYAIDKVIQQPKWDTIDMVSHDGHLYSSKPPLWPTLMAAVYWPIHRISCATLGTHPYEIGRAMLVLFNLVPLLIYFLVLARLVERFGTTDWGRIFVMASAVFGTFLTTFAVVINNHLPAAVCAAVAVYALVRIWFDGDCPDFRRRQGEPVARENGTVPLARPRLRYFIIAGLFGTLAAVNEFPAAGLLALVSVVLLWKAPRPTLVAFAPAVLLVAAAFFGANYAAHRTIKPAYLHKGGADNWYDYTYQRNGKEIVSHWRNPTGIDRGEPSQAVYAANVLVGHHGIFSLTPIWLLSVVGLGLWIFQGRDPRLRWIALSVAALSLACVAFYLIQPLMNRNYGGATSGLRWLFWLAPLWLLVMLPAADLLSTRRWTRGLALLLLAISVLSVSYPTWNPWTHPWLMNYMQYLGVV
jgi:hypothetical protein